MVYATIDNNNIVNGIKEIGSAVGSASHIEIPNYDLNLLGKTYINGVFVNVTLTFAEQKQEKINQLHIKYQKMYDDYLAQYPRREVDSFAVKQAEATAYTLDNTTATPIIDAIVGNNATLKSAYITAVMAKVTALAQQEGKMVAIRDSIKACTTQAELDAIVI